MNPQTSFARVVKNKCWIKRFLKKQGPTRLTLECQQDAFLLKSLSLIPRWPLIPCLKSSVHTATLWDFFCVPISPSLQDTSKIGLNVTVCLKVWSPVTILKYWNLGLQLRKSVGTEFTPYTGMGALLNCTHVASLLSSSAVWPRISTGRVPLSRHPCQPLLAEQFSILLAKWGRDTLLRTIDIWQGIILCQRRVSRVL